MSYFKGNEAIAVIKVPDELYESIMQSGSEIGKLIQEDSKSGSIKISDPNGTQKKYSIHFSEVDRKSILFAEDSGEFKMHFLSQFSGACIPDDEDDLVKNLTDYIDAIKKETDQRDIQLDNKVWEAQARKPTDRDKTRVRKADVWSEDKLKERLFQVFEENDTLSYDDLKEKTNAAKATLEKCLKEIADMTVSKEGKSFQLKEQYRRATAPGANPSKKVKS